MTADELTRWLKTESHVLPLKDQRAFAKFLDRLNPPQRRLALKGGRGKRA